jgi:hypothetical protein
MAITGTGGLIPRFTQRLPRQNALSDRGSNSM